MLKFLAKLTVLAFFGVLAGCTADWDPARQGRLHAAAHHPQAPNVVVQSDRMGLAAGKRSSKFATLPDRGELAVYDPGAKPRVSGAYSAYPVHLSEEHALKAAHAGGHMVIRAPDGKTIMLAYERHVEHPDGNWTWIGRDAQGADAVITFGEEAAFGTIPQVDEESLRLTMWGGQTWLVATDRSKLPDTDRALTRSGEDDYLIPPKMAVGAALNKTSAGASPQAVSAAIAPAAATTVDVVLGYTTGLAAALGGNSQAVTRLNNLVEIGNQAYANSGVNATLRLVGTVSVNFTDASDNGDTLEKLTGYKDGTGSIPPDPAFAALRAARDTYGADLVSLVRDFRTPQNNGCGIAWLIGGGQTGIEQGDAPFGYSVVSDGSDVDEGDGQTYFCRDESMVHELGHNMGQAHNSADSAGTSGVHAYSYGYREASSNGFYTVMAYRLSGSSQFAIRHFANPNVLYDGRPTGVANASDNTRSMNTVLPIVATFRQSTVPVPQKARHDADGDGKSDLLWFNASSSELNTWIMNGPNYQRSWTQVISNICTARGAADFDGDNRSDVIWTCSNGTVWLWPSNGSSYGLQYVGGFFGGWAIVGTGDADGDGKADLLWHNAASGELNTWVMNGAAVSRTWTQSASNTCTPRATGDFDGNGKSDVAWTCTNGSVWIWPSNGTSYGLESAGGFAAGWQLVGGGDADGDGKSDLFWYHAGSGQLNTWVMNGSALARSWTQSVSNTCSPRSFGDFDGNAKSDIAWTCTNGSIWMWPSDGASYGLQYVGGFIGGWSLVF